MVLISDFLRSENLTQNRHIFPTNVFICNVVTFKQMKTPPQYENSKNQKRGEEKGKQRKIQTERDRNEQHLAISSNNLSPWARIQTQDQVRRSGPELSVIWKAVKINVRSVIMTNPPHHPKESTYIFMASSTGRQQGGVGAAHTLQSVRQMKQPGVTQVRRHAVLHTLTWGHVKNTHTQSVLSERDEWIRAPCYRNGEAASTPALYYCQTMGVWECQNEMNKWDSKSVF